MVGREIVDFYQAGLEEGRLTQGLGRLEYLRTFDILDRFLPERGCVLDVGGGTGVYAFPLADRGYEVHLIDASPLHVERARALSNARLASIAVGDARQLPVPDSSFDVVLMFGPLYHLIDRRDRTQALSEALRVLRPNGRICTAYISRFASANDGIQEGKLRDPEFAAIVERDLIDGVHLNPTQHLEWFTTAYFHHPADIGPELEEAGFAVEQILAVEGIGWVHENLDSWLDHPKDRERLLSVLRKVEAEPSLLGASAHLIAISHRP